MQQRDDASLDKLIATTQLHPLMSNAKWVKLIAALVEHWQLVRQCRVKLIWEDVSTERYLLLDEHTRYNFDYYATAVEAMITGRPRGWYAYKEIEWLEFPRFPSGESEAQHLEAIQQRIEAIGQFQLLLDGDKLRLYAYLRP